MIPHEIIDSLRRRIYSSALFMVGNEPIFGRDGFIQDCIADCWWALLERVELLDFPSAIDASSFVDLLRQFIPELEMDPDDSPNRFVVRTRNCSYKVRGGPTGFEISPRYRHIPLELAHKMLRFGINPNVEDPELFLVQLFTTFDESVPELLEIIREEEFRARADFKEFTLCETILRSILEPLPVEPLFRLQEGKTKCEIETDDWALSFCVSSSELPAFTRSLYDEMVDIIRNPQSALRFGDKYLLE